MSDRTLAWLLAVVASCSAMPDASPSPPTRWYPDIIISGGIDVDAVWRDDELAEILNRPGGAPPLDDHAIDAVLHPASEQYDAENLKLDQRLSGQAGAITSPPPVNEDLPLQ